MRLDRPMRLRKGEMADEEDRSRPIEAPRQRVMLNNCQRCKGYKYVLCLVGGPFAYLCGRCNREVNAAREGK